MRLLCSLVSLLLLTLPACAQHAGQGSAAPVALDAVLDIQDVIAGQVAAFRMGDAAGAYAYAAPSIQATFTTPEEFAAMVAQGYGQIFAAYDYEFGATAGTMAQPVQLVLFTGADFTTVMAFYLMEPQGDGSWRIAAVQIIPAEGNLS